MKNNFTAYQKALKTLNATLIQNKKNPHAEFLAGEALESVETATTVRPRDNDVTITDGPFAETKEQLVGFYMIEARDLNHAIDYAKGIPAARVGSIEVRPVRNLDI